MRSSIGLLLMKTDLVLVPATCLPETLSRVNDAAGGDSLLEGKGFSKAALSINEGMTTYFGGSP